MTEATAAPPRKRAHLVIRLWPVWLILGGLVLAWSLGVFRVLSLDTLREQRSALTGYVAAHPALSVAIYLVVYAVATVLMIPGALWITISGGFLFGLAGGSIATVIGATVGASILFFAAKSSIGRALRDRAGPWLARIERGFRENELSYMFAMRFTPVMPYPVSNIAPALLGAKYWAYALTTALGIIPGVVAYTWIGAGLGATFDAGENPDFARVAANLVPAGLALAVVSLLPIAYKKLFGRRVKLPDSPPAA